MLRALYEVISKSGANMSEASRTAVLGLIDSDASGLEGKFYRETAQILELIGNRVNGDNECPSRRSAYQKSSSQYQRYISHQVRLTEVSIDSSNQD